MLITRNLIIDFSHVRQLEALNSFTTTRRTYGVAAVKIVDFGNFGCKIGLLLFANLTKNPCDYKTRAQELTSGAIRMFLYKILEHF